MTPNEDGTPRWCGHAHREVDAAVACFDKIRRRWPRMNARITVALSLSSTELAKAGEVA